MLLLLLLLTAEPGGGAGPASFVSGLESLSHVRAPRVWRSVAAVIIESFYAALCHAT